MNRNRLTVINVAYPLAPVSSDAVGGAEQVLRLVDDALYEAGHRSIVIACEGSQVRGELRSFPLPSAPFDETAKRQAHAQVRRLLREVLSVERVDLVHMHGIDFHVYLPEAGPPVLATLHLPIQWYPHEALHPTRPDTYLHCVSASQRARCPADVRLLPDIPNGISLRQLTPSQEHEEYALVLGRVCPEKGVHLALQAAHRADQTLLIAGKVYPYEAHQRYFDEQVAPLLDERRRFLGPVGMGEKPRLLARARCVLVPSCVPETSSLSAMEALASGTPVIAFSEGALPSIVEDGVTGFIVKDVEELARAMQRIDRVDRQACRQAAEQRFSAETCAARYLATYAELSRARRPPVNPPSLLQARTVRDLDGVRKLASDWRALWDRCPDATVFQRPEWLVPWCEQMMLGEPRVVAVYQEERLLGLCPLFRYQSEQGNMLGLMGAGVTDYQTVLIEPEARNAVMTALEAHLREQRDWDGCSFSELLPDSPLLEARLGDVSTRMESQEVCPALSLQGRNTLDQLLPHKFWADLAYARRRATRDGAFQVERADAQSFDALFAALVQLHGERRAARGDRGALDSQRARVFHRTAARALLEVDALRLYGVRLQGELVACLYALRDRTATRYYLSGFSQRHARYSVGSLVIGHAIEEALAEGATLFDFLRGAEPYKYRWGATDRLTLQRRVLARRSRVDAGAHSVWAAE